MIKSVKRFILRRLNKSWLRRNRTTARSDFIHFVALFLDKESHRYSFDEIFDELSHMNDMFKIDTLKCIIRHYFKELVSNPAMNSIHCYECRLQNFFRNTRISQLKDKVVATVPAADDCDILSIILSYEWDTVSWTLLENLMKKVFGVHSSICLRPVVTTGSVKVQWSFRRDFKDKLIECAKENEDILKASDVLELWIGGEEVFSQREVCV